ncbi:hypothetical protein G6F70_002418 [Rhizopus microsporus]|nr:hypothetical protein G6F71_006190 [Rhizopus microsporus]KAG1202272.1 hypothetical protein G6F70_002418 [Rhizopus microsporus]KAG1209748.1 hypothetical protein G6F69_006089 [Rhizopus microsporus]KAG1231170.1 hypothetical protein G6F67_005951 [Rhizopus microsporus]KAG1263967.1 hypothetical protein G6F68_004731 [Rhizopus microsporus]
MCQYLPGIWRVYLQQTSLQVQVTTSSIYHEEHLRTALRCVSGVFCCEHTARGHTTKAQSSLDSHFDLANSQSSRFDVSACTTCLSYQFGK